MAGNRRISGYARKERDFYQTPEWVTEALIKNVAMAPDIWEPACGDDAIVRVFTRNLFNVAATDIKPGPNSIGLSMDFLQADPSLVTANSDIVTNPPFSHAKEFIEKALTFTRRNKTRVAMLLPVDYDSASTRKYLFKDHDAFKYKLVLTKRIRWFAGTSEDKGKSPMGNHAWFVWDWTNHSAPVILYD